MTETYDWREGINLDTAHRIETHISQFLEDIAYSKENPSAGTTAKRLDDIQQSAEVLETLLESLSPVGHAALFEFRQDNGIPVDRRELDQLSKTLSRLRASGRIAAENLRRSHSPESEGGQGSGSALGRGSDLEAIRDDDEDLERFRFRTPKDKFGVRISIAMAMSESEPDARIVRGKKSLIEFLTKVWEFEGLGERQSWDEIARQREHIIAAAEKRSSAEKDLVRHEATWTESIERVRAKSDPPR